MIDLFIIFAIFGGTLFGLYLTFRAALYLLVKLFGFGECMQDLEELKELREQKPIGFVRMDSFIDNKIYQKNEIEKGWDVLPVYLGSPPVAQSRDSAEPEFQCGDSIVHTFQKSSNDSAKGLGILQRSKQSNVKAANQFREAIAKAVQS